MQLQSELSVLGNGSLDEEEFMAALSDWGMDMGDIEGN